jgi:hypothetical protein
MHGSRESIPSWTKASRQGCEGLLNVNACVVYSTAPASLIMISGGALDDSGNVHTLAEDEVHAVKSS